MDLVHSLATIVHGLRAKRSGKNWLASCPAHDDRNPSLSLAAGSDGTILFYCHGGCSQEAVLIALRDRGLWPEARFRSPRPKPTSRLHGANDTTHQAQQLDKARCLWQRSVPGTNTLVERYLVSRSIPGPVPSCLRFLIPRKAGHHPAMIAPFGLAHESEPGNFLMPPSRVMGVHLTLLRPDGGGKAGTPHDKLMIGPSSGWPIMIAPINDVGGLAIAEGVEDALSIHRATGLGAWAAGAANRLPKLAGVMPLDAECVTIVVDDDAAGRRGSEGLARSLVARGLDVLMLVSRSVLSAAA